MDDECQQPEESESHLAFAGDSLVLLLLGMITLFVSTTTGLHFLGDQESSDDDWSDMAAPKETLESDEELRMHLLGMNSYFTEQGAKLSYSAMLFVII